ncbi:F-box only protein 15 [Exaiptasia diaphana]|uniref:F-box domain-containing protein n=1 Tax=Exaiptasia diaphana TaxID=2652724 RepID=A0A913X7A8_EXADI|nr:F-box only protein 15 [Exaiptasia diaphana]KXJ26872.1 F-box only protein 15 [Exaiptasia diaphana]
MVCSMSSQRHQQHLSTYLKTKKNSPAKVSKNLQSCPKSTGTCCSQKSKTERQPLSSLKTHSVQKHIHRIQKKNEDHINSLPDETLFKIFGYLSLSELLICAQVCCRWSTLSKDRSIWEQGIFLSLPQEVRKLFSFDETKEENFNWKKQIIKRCISARNSKFASSKKKVNPYTCLQADVQNILKNLCVSWKICFTDTRGREHWATSSEATYFTSSVSVRWLSLQLPSLPQLKTMRLFSCVPVFFNKAWKPHKKSSTTHSLLMDFDLKEKGYTLSKDKSDAEGDMISAHFIYPELILACWTSSWKDGGEVAFITACLHYNNLLKRALLGSFSNIFQAPLHKPVLDDVDSQYGLHGYSAMVELRNHKASYWSHQFRDLNYSNMTSNCIILRDFPNGSFSKKITLPWKTELFRNTLQDVCILDFTILDEHRKPMWCKSSPVKVHQNENPDVNYSSEGDCFYITYSDDKGTLRLDLTWNSNEDQTRVVAVEFLLLKSFVNQWFGRSY